LKSLDDVIVEKSVKDNSIKDKTVKDEIVEEKIVVVSLAAEVEEELVDDCGVLVPALDPLTEVNPTKISVVTG
jgi:hypothetical protein